MKHIAQRIREIFAEDAYQLWHQVLRPPLSRADFRLEGDHDQNSLHLEAFLDNEHVRVPSFIPRNNPDFEATPQFKATRMAIQEHAWNRKVGKRRLLHGENLLHNKCRKPLIWLHAGGPAVEFYRKYKCESLGRLFEIPKICLAILMYKMLF